MQLALKKIRRDGVKFVRGQECDAYCLTSLPPRYIHELDGIAERRGYRNTEHLLTDPPLRFAPVDKNGRRVPLADISRQQTERADRLRQGLALTLQYRDRLTEGDCKRIALAAFRRAWGHASEKTWENKYKRTIQRDAGEERFDDLALYFDEVVTRKPEARERIALGATAADRTLLDALNAKDPAKPTLAEKALVWVTACEFIQDAIDRGEKRKRAMRRVFELVSGSRVTLAKTEDALKRLIKEKFFQWLREGRTFAALEDKRPLNSGRRGEKLDENERLQLVSHIVKQTGGRVSQGVRELRDRGELSLEVIGRTISNPASKSYVPPFIRKAVTADVRRLANIHRGEREHRLKGAYHDRSWDGIAPGDWFTSDDLTPPVYFYTRENGRVEVMRGQFLPMMDERTGMILGFVLIPERNYNSISIRSLITNVCAIHGLPRHGFAFERGIWKSSKVLTGDRNTDPDEIANTGLRRLGLQMRHALLPRAKVVERALGQLQDRMEGLAGYCGRNEKTERFERLQRAKLDVETGRAEPSDHFMNEQEMRAAYAQIVDRYNHEPQDGKRLKGLSPAEGWAQIEGAEPRQRFDDRLLYFLASDVRRLKVGRNGLTITVGKQRFNYKGEETGRRVGETFFVWWNPQRPDMVTCTEDINGSGAFTVERSFDLPAVHASRELLAEENRKVNAHNRYARDLYHVFENKLPPTAFRGQIADLKTVRFGEVMAEQQEEKRALRSGREDLDALILKAARRAGKSPSLVPRTKQALEGMQMLAEANAEINRSQELKEKSPI